MRVDVDGNSWFSSVIAAVAIVAVAAVTVVAVVASAGAVACVAAGVATTLGASAGTAAAVSTVATAGCYAVATGVAACGASDVYEVATGTNPIRDGIFGGDQEAYDTVKGLLSLASAGLTELASQAMAAGMSCFIAGTPVVTADGQKRIEDIQVGDYVWAWDEETDDVALKQVVETYINETTELMHVFVNGEEIVATPTHPFYCPVKGWTDAAHLRAGDILVLVNGEYVVVEKVQHELLESPVKVYNFQVEDYHTYYVATGVLVHNKCSNRFDDDQQALLELTKDKKSGVTMDEAETLVSWGDEYGMINNRIDLGHPSGSNPVTQGPHLHLGPYNHIPIIK